MIWEVVVFGEFKSVIYLGIDSTRVPSELSQHDRIEGTNFRVFFAASRM
jgi:hypothetical protein